jgi:glucarate dehydratase
LLIKEVRIYPLAAADPPLRSSYGRHAPYVFRAVLELRSTDGPVGIAETHGSEVTVEALRRLAPRLLGQDPFQLSALWRCLNAEAVSVDRSQTWLVPGENPADLQARLFAAIEIASLDLIGQAVGKPVCDLLGGRARDAAPFSAYLFYKHAGGGGLGGDARDDEYGECLTPESMVGQARRFIERYGFKEIKLKGGVLAPELEIETIRQLRRAFGPGVPLRIDPNCAWSVDTSLHVGRSLVEELAAGGYLEDPAPGMDGMAEVRRRLLGEGITTPLASNVAVTSFADIVPAWRSDAVQIVLSDPHYWGGVRNVQKLSSLCGLLGMGVSMHSNNHLGVSLMAMAHACAASPEMTYACDTHYPWQTGRDEIAAGGRVRFVAGAVPIPELPGLGVRLDYDQVARLQERYERLPAPRRRDDAAEMRQHVDPAWERVVPRW